ncbi:histidine phosphatase family protein [Microbulbifer bruguierae]|uniref:Histidine phosphatase family protein n=1 Tax=Microbulbifer bruguierae TaxID=3029061 RepID=A0ABY8NC92_9GAMM|nr:histidine phosphatase family protein [Microbulbifer bruguierae]WGL16538.1 histidine phosphatase family protein [Microbulbifer bruguierae]
MPEIFAVRHGQASFGSDNYDQLSELGWQQARWLGEHWAEAGEQFDHIVCGDLRRHRETAQGICDGLGADTDRLQELPQLNEFDFKRVMQAYEASNPGVMPGPGAARADYYRVLKQAMHAWSVGEIHAAETWQEFEQRIEEVLGIIAAGASRGRTLVVSSGGAIAMMVRQILGAPAHGVIQLNMQIKNTAVSHFFAGRSGLSLHSFNHVPHLDSGQRRQYITYS